MNLFNMKPFQLIFMAVFGFLAVAGLFLFASFKGFGGSTVAVGNVLIWGTLPQDAVKTELTALKNAEPSYGGLSYVQRPQASFSTDLAEAIATGNGPDLILVSQEDLHAQENKLTLIPFATIAQRSFLDAYVPEADLYLTQQGTYGIPLVVDPLVLYYNRTQLAAAGVATPPTSWEAVLGLAQTLTRRDAGSFTTSAIALGTYGNIPDARAIISMFLLQSGNTITESPSDLTRSSLAQIPVTESFGVSPAESALNYYTQFADPAKLVYSWDASQPDARQAFLSGDLSMYLGFASEEAVLAKGNPNLDFDMARIPNPQTATTRSTYGNIYAFSIIKSSKNAAGALSAAQALANPAYAKYAAPALSMAPALRSLLSPSASDPYQAVYYPEALIAKGWLSPAPSVVDSIFSTMINDIMSGKRSSRGSISNADQALQSAL